MKNKILVLTPKQVKEIISSLRSTAGLRSKEKDRAYLRKIVRELEGQ